MIKIICVGKIKEKYLREAIEEYKKRLSKYTKLEIIEVSDIDNPSIEISLLKEKELMKRNMFNIKDDVLFFFGSSLLDFQMNRLSLEQLKSIPTEVSKDEYAGRYDFTGVTIMYNNWTCESTVYECVNSSSGCNLYKNFLKILFK